MTSRRTFAAGSNLNVLAACTIAAVALLGNEAASAQSADVAQVQGSGTATSQRIPETMRVFVELSGRGKSLTEALAALKDRREAATAVLPTLGAAADSIKFGDLTVTRGEDQQKMNEMMMERMRGRTKRATAGEETKLPTTVTAVLSADYPLGAKDVEQLVVRVHELQEKIKAADLAGTKEAKKLTPEEEELQAEMAQMNGGQPSAAPGEPQYLFVAKIAPEDRSKLTTEAFEKAKSDAESLAQAAGAKLGKLTSLHQQAQAGGVNQDQYNYYYEMQRNQGQALRASMIQSAMEATDEAFGSSPAKVKFAVQVSATFRLD